MENRVETAVEVLRDLAATDPPKSRVEVAVELLEGSRSWSEKAEALSQTAAMLLREMNQHDVADVARRLGGGWTPESLVWLAHGGRHDRRR